MARQLRFVCCVACAQWDSTNVLIVGFANWFILPYQAQGTQTVSAVFMGMIVGGAGTYASCPVFNIGQVGLVE